MRRPGPFGWREVAAGAIGRERGLPHLHRSGECDKKQQPGKEFPGAGNNHNRESNSGAVQVSSRPARVGEEWPGGVRPWFERSPYGPIPFPPPTCHRILSKEKVN